MEKTNLDEQFDDEFSRITDENFNEATATDLEVTEDEPVDVVEEEIQEPAPEVNAEDILNAKLEQEAATWKGRIQREQEEKARLQKELDELKAAEKTKKSKETVVIDNAVLTEFKEDFPDIEKAVSMLLAQMKEQIISEVLGIIDSRVAPIIETTEAQAKESHFQIIQSAHPDVLDILKSGALDAWMDKQPKRLREASIEIRQHGSSEDVIDLLDRFKKETGWASEPEKPQPAVITKPSAVLAVKSRPTAAPRSNSDPEDFDSVFNKITAQR